MNKKLFAFDLDGTLLSDSKKGLSIETVKMVERLRKEGHIVCILTGRPWRATRDIYNHLELDTIVANYNGAHIHNPKDYEFLPIVERMSTASVAKIISNPQMKKISKNTAIEGPSYLLLDKLNEEDYFYTTFLKADATTKVESPISFEKINSEPTGVLIEIKKQYAPNIQLIKSYFESKFGDLVEFSYWDTGPDREPIFEFTNRRARKDIALIRIARYYDMEMADVIAFGDGFNDVQMLKVAGVGVAMANSNDIVKSFANVISKHTNADDGVVKFIKWYLDEGYLSVDKTIYDFEETTSELKLSLQADD